MQINSVYKAKKFPRISVSNTLIDLTSSCVAQWKMNDNTASTTVVDYMGYSDGTAQQNTEDINAVGKINGALSFNGTSDYVNTNDYFKSIFQNSFSISFWCKPDDGQPDEIAQSLFGLSAEYINYIFLQTNGKILFIYETTDPYPIMVESSIVFANGQETWHHIVIVIEKINITQARGKLYSDGVLAGDSGIVDDVNMPAWNCSENPFLGDWNNSGEPDPVCWFDGSLDNMMIFNKALS
jgi:hypothetical protein